MTTDVAIECRGLVKHFGRHRAVDGLDMVVRLGQVFGFLGPNGAGKSTTIRLLLDLIRPDAGSASIFGRAVRTDRRTVLSRVGAMVERPDLYEHLSGRRNLEILARLSGPCGPRRIDEVLEMVGLTDRQRDRVSSYSHGMRQRLGLAQAMLPSPDLLILDEPANGLDPSGLIDVRNLLRRIASEQGVTVFLSSHLLSEVELVCSHVALISRGRCVVQGAVSDLLSTRDSTADIEVSDADLAARVAGELPFVTSAERRDAGLVVRCSDGRLADVNAALVTAGVRVQALVPRKTTLEERYMSAMSEADHADANAR